MAVKQNPRSLQSQDGSYYVTLTDGIGNLVGAPGPSGGTSVEGTVASGVADSGNPVKVGGKYNVTQPTLVDGQRGDMQLGVKGALSVAAVQALGGADASSNNSMSGLSVQPSGSASFAIGVGPYSFNNTTWDRVRNNVDTTGLVTLSAATAGTFNGTDQINYNGRGIQVLVDVTAATAMTLTINIQGKDAVSGKYYTILSSAALAAVASTQLTVYPDTTVVANVAVSQPLPRTWRVQAVVTGTSVTATVGASVIL